MESCFRSSSKIAASTILLFFLCSCFKFTSTDAYDALDPNGNIMVKWDIINWTPDGYVAIVTIFNFQQYRHIQAPGWTLGWTWAKKEVIWGMKGGQTTEQGDCSSFKQNIPHCCKKDPTVVDLLLGTPYDQQVVNCCKGGVIGSWAQDPANSASSFQLSVGDAGTSTKTVSLPKNFTMRVPGPGYTCGPAKIVKPSKFQFRFVRWETSCTGHDPDSPRLTRLVQCTSHMCPIRVHWHVKLSYKEYWRVKVTVTNFNYGMNYTQWNLVVQHPNFDNLTQIFSFDYKPLTPYQNINDTALLWGVKFYNDLLMQAGPLGNVQSELLFRKDKSRFTFEKGWAFPRRIYFNGDNCVIPPPDSYPYLPNAGLRKNMSFLTLIITLSLSVWLSI
ncbi:Protein COBRA [Striga hermonthica]|uniref:Protein COBRA n=1 Tax=Striga hermonthica TaxID=68872 RepID=A0A9N7N1F7_STRHE|nr:Protein COBRA [Striga hermonthica]